eukprot:365653-Chlamydomonas_euryale.AAC.7
MAAAAGRCAGAAAAVQRLYPQVATPALLLRCRGCSHMSLRQRCYGSAEAAATGHCASAATAVQRLQPHVTAPALLRQCRGCSHMSHHRSSHLTATCHTIAAAAQGCVMLCQPCRRAVGTSEACLGPISPSRCQARMRFISPTIRPLERFLAPVCGVGF